MKDIAMLSPEFDCWLTLCHEAAEPGGGEVLEADLEAVDVVAELGVVVEQQQPGQVVHCTAAHVLRDEPGEGEAGRGECQ